MRARSATTGLPPMSLPSASASGEACRRRPCDLMISPSVTISRALVRDLEAHRRLAGNDLDDAHADRGQRAREVLGEVRDLADLDARRRAQLEARDHRARVHLDDLDLDAEVAQLQLDQPRHRFERLGRITALRVPADRRAATAAAARSAPGFSNSATCCSFSTRSLFSTCGAGAARSSAACARRPSSAPRARLPARACFTSLADACASRRASRAARARTRRRAAPSDRCGPCTSSQDTPVHERAPSRATRRAAAASRRGSSSPRPGPRRAACRARRPRNSGTPAPEKCSVARPQLLASASSETRPRGTRVERRSSGSRLRRSWNSRPAGDGQHDREQDRRARRTARRTGPTARRRTARSGW